MRGVFACLQLFDFCPSLPYILFSATTKQTTSNKLHSDGHCRKPLDWWRLHSLFALLIFVVLFCVGKRNSLHFVFYSWFRRVELICGIAHDNSDGTGHCPFPVGLWLLLAKRIQLQSSIFIFVRSEKERGDTEERWKVKLRGRECIHAKGELKRAKRKSPE